MENLKLYIFGRPENTIYFSDVPEHVIAASSEEMAYEIISGLEDFDENISLNNVINLNQITENLIIL